MRLFSRVRFFLRFILSFPYYCYLIRLVHSCCCHVRGIMCVVHTSCMSSPVPYNFATIYAKWSLAFVVGRSWPQHQRPLLICLNKIAVPQVRPLVAECPRHSRRAHQPWGVAVVPACGGRWPRRCRWYILADRDWGSRHYAPAWRHASQTWLCCKCCLLCRGYCSVTKIAVAVKMLHRYPLAYIL